MDHGAHMESFSGITRYKALMGFVFCVGEVECRESSDPCVVCGRSPDAQFYGLQLFTGLLDALIPRARVLCEDRQRSLSLLYCAMANSHEFTCCWCSAIRPVQKQI